MTLVRWLTCCLVGWLLFPADGYAENAVRYAGYFGARAKAPDVQRQFKSTSSTEEHAAQKALTAFNLYDTDNPDFSRLQGINAAVQGFPKDANGFPDWMRALREGRIEPRAGLESGARMDVLNLDIIMKNTKEMPYVRFGHAAHTQWLDCSNCHPAPFEPRTGATKLGMSDIFRGKFCGMCHDKVAFVTFFSCARCHSVPQTGAVSAR